MLECFSNFLRVLDCVCNFRVIESFVSVCRVVPATRVEAEDCKLLVDLTWHTLYNLSDVIIVQLMVM